MQVACRPKPHCLGTKNCWLNKESSQVRDLIPVLRGITRSKAVPLGVTRGGKACLLEW